MAATNMVTSFVSSHGIFRKGGIAPNVRKTGCTQENRETAIDPPRRAMCYRLQYSH